MAKLARSAALIEKELYLPLRYQIFMTSTQRNTELKSGVSQFLMRGKGDRRVKIKLMLLPC